MKLQFNKTDFKPFCQSLLENGFKKYNGQIHNEDYYFYKPLVRIENEYGDRRSVLQVFFSVYDFSKYSEFPHPDNLHLQAEIQVSRNMDERIDLIIDAEKFNSIEELEEFALNFYEFIKTTL